MSRTFAIMTHGCKVNQYESRAMEEAWTSQGWKTGAADGADVICVSTCAVTAKAVADARAAVRRAHRENPQARIVVTGCAAEAMREEFESLPGVVAVVGQKSKGTLLQQFGQEPAEPQSVDVHHGDYPPFAVAGYGRTRAVVKVQDGCSHHCAYCIVPLTRGPSVSRSPEDTLAETSRLLEAGFREIVLNGINLFQYGRDLDPKQDFWDLLACLEGEFAARWAGKARIRLSSLEPGQLGSKALDVLGASRLVAPHVHLSLQSGSASVLRRMGRGHYSPTGLAVFFEQLRTIWPHFGLGADLLTGFPGETEAEAEETEALCRDLPFSYAHVFPYSARPGTRASAMPGQVASTVKKERAARLRTIFTAKRAAFLNSCLDLPLVRVALEPVKEGRQGGVNEFYSECRFREPAALPEGKDLVPVRPVGIEGETLQVAPIG